MSEKERNIEYKGRIKIYSDVSEINQNNVIDVLSKALVKHEMNRTQIRELIDFEKGHQPLVRTKKVCKEIDIKATSNLAHQITEFWLGYFWGNHMAFVQKSSKHPKGSEETKDDTALTIFNEYLDLEEMEYKDQRLAYYLEVVGTCCQLIDIKRKRDVDEDAPFDLVTLDPMYSFVVYSSGAYEQPIMGVSYVENEDGTKDYTCITDDTVYIIRNAMKIINGEKKDKYSFDRRSGERNPFGRINIVEFERATDRTGVFERAIDNLNALNVLESDLVNDVAQTTQANWWGNDIDLKKDKDGNPLPPAGGQWILTKTAGNGNKPDIKSLVLDYDYEGVLKNIQAKHDEILETTFTPRQTDQKGGSTTGATSLSSGWMATEAVACKQSAIVKRGFRERNRLILIAIKKAPNMDESSPVMKLKNSDIDIRPIRNKTFDMATKVNCLATMIQNMTHPRVAMETVDLFPNLAEAVEDSVPKMLEYQDMLLKSKQAGASTFNQKTVSQKDEVESQKDSVNSDTKRIMQDSSDQADNSPMS